MLLKTLSYLDKRTGWTVQDFKLDRFNLLVGASGVGKTRLLRAIREIRATAFGKSELALLIRTNPSVSISFAVDFEHEGDDYTWEFESSPAPSNEGSPHPQQASTSRKTLVTREKLTSTQAGVLFERDPDSFLFGGKVLPQLNPTESALALIAEPTIQQVQAAFEYRLLDEHKTILSDRLRSSSFARIKAKLRSVEELRSSFTPVAVVTKALLLQECFPSEFTSLKERFIEIFPSVKDIAVTKTATMDPLGSDPDLRFTFEMREHHVPGSIPVEDFSSGMLRTLTHLIDIWLAPAGSVILIDEFENSLGVNCMGPLTEFIQSRASELQFIITSHHPYIINKIPKSHWKVVRRKGSVVRVTPASEIKALQGTSAQDDFTRLLNSPEFEEGLA